MRTLFIGLILILIALQLKVWFGDGNVIELLHLKKKYETQALENQKILDRNLLVASEIDELKHGTKILEDKARYELGMIKRNETYYQFSE